MIYEELLEKLALNIKIERIKKKMTQAQLAEIMDVHEKYIGKIEAGKQNITLKTLCKISEALSIEISSLFI